MKFSGIAVAFIAIIFLLPFLILPNFIHLSVDDFCRYDASLDNFYYNFNEWLNNHNGRYSNAIFSLLPVYQIDYYRIISFLSIFIFFVISFFFNSILIKKTSKSTDKLQVSALAVAFTIYLVNNLSSTGEFFYWYAGITAYLYSIVGFLLLILSFLNFNYNIIRFFTIPLLIIILIGNNEFAMVITNLLLFLLNLNSFYRKKKVDNYLIIYLIIALIFSVFVIFSDGNNTRLNNYENNQDILHSFYISFYSTFIYFLRNVINISSILFWIPFLLVVNKLKNADNVYPKIRILVLCVMAFCAMWSLFFVGYYALGSFNSSTGRIGNFFSIIFNLSIFFIVLSQPKIDFRISKSLQSLISKIMIGLLMLIFLIGHYPSSLAWKDILFGNAFNYNSKVNIRERKIENHSGKTLKIDIIKMPTSLQTPDILSSPSLERECYKNMIIEKYDLDVERIEFN